MDDEIITGDSGELKSLKEDGIKKEIGTNTTKYIQSSNSLFHFMKKIEYLKTEISEKCMVPRYFDEDASFYNLPK